MPASWANELGLKIRQPNPIGPPVAADRNVMTARIVRAIDQDPSHTGGAHLGEGDLLRSGDGGRHAP